MPFSLSSSCPATVSLSSRTSSGCLSRFPLLSLRDPNQLRRRRQNTSRTRTNITSHTKALSNPRTPKSNKHKSMGIKKRGQATRVSADPSPSPSLSLLFPCHRAKRDYLWGKRRKTTTTKRHRQQNSCILQSKSLPI